MRISSDAATLRRGRLAAAAVAGLVVVLGGVAAVPTASAATTCANDRRDVFVGVPRAGASRGAVDVHQYGRDAQVLTRANLGFGTGAAGDRFGASVAHGRADNGCAFLVIGAPGVNGRGAVYFAVDTPDGFVGAGAIKPSGGAGDRFGDTVLLSPTPENDGIELWVGAPRRDIGGAVDAGAIDHFTIFGDLTHQPSAVRQQTLQQGTASVPGTSAEPNDRFGEVLAGGGGLSGTGIVVGVPHEDVGSAVDAGMVTIFGMTGDVNIYRGMRNVTQATAGMPGAPEPGDRFGAAVTPCAHVIGAPGEDVGSVRDAGLVQLLKGCAPDKLVIGAALTQNSPGIPGHNEAGDRFGAAVAEYSTSKGGDSPVIGVPGEDVGRIADAGAVVGRYPGRDDWYALHQGAGLAGTPEAGDALGSVLAVRHFYPLRPGEDLWDHVTSYPLAGAPGEDVGTVRNAGAVYGRDSSSTDAQLSVLHYSRGPVTDLRFGSVLASYIFGKGYLG